MDAGLTARELTESPGVTECTVYIWEIKGGEVKPLQSGEAERDYPRKAELRRELIAGTALDN